MMDFVTEPAENLCIGCLGPGRMYNIQEYNLLQPYLLLTGLKVPENDTQAKNLCHFCSMLLKKYTAFRERCLQSFVYLNICSKISKEHMNQELIAQYKRKDLYSYCNQESININMCDIKIDDSDDHMMYNNDVKDKPVYINKCDSNCDDQSIHHHDKKEELNNIVNKDKPTDLNCDVIKCDENTYSDIKSENEEIFTNNCVNNKIKKYTKHVKKITFVNKLYLENKKIEKNNKEIKKSSIKTVLKTLLRKQTFKLSSEEGRRIFENKYGVNITIMTEEEKIRDLKERHIEIYGGVKCTLCGKYFKNESLLDIHKMDMHDESKPQCCEYCGYRTETRRSLQYHIVRNHKYKLTCLTCGLLIRTPNRVAEHHRTHTGQTFSCRFCGVVCKKSKHYRLHLRKAHPSELTWCYICGEVFINLENHLRASHKDVLKSNYKCMKCNSYFMNQEALDKHIGVQTDKPCDKNCYQCAESFSNEKLLRVHFDEHHKLTERKTVRKSSIKKASGRMNYANGAGGVCDVCGKVIRTKNGLEYHMMIHRGDLPFSCDHCGKKFRCKTSLTNHSRVHSGERPFSCELCQKAFTSQAGLYRHRRVHTGEKSHQCDICTKYYSTSSGLKAHVKAVHMKMPLNK